ncbi:acyl-CoA dehydrogenase family protein [Nitratireductor sp. StC3]|uniref:acyl-CoA dehydrogenase family protein n=1 Tax=Nitratireductor sp. StC3 TaxID=2126741 RepID=UPI000D0D8618|nr:acyl-CoA dehydrogenase family protein [Nitratireductor sp. StC3]PSM19391.1 acyl-CoA dehydrogenase [Nitratireductor sp. StC3]
MKFGIPRTLYDDVHEQFRDTVVRFIQAEVLPHYESWEDAGRTPREIWKRAGEIGILGTSVPEAYGGMGGDFLFDAIVLEELGRFGVAAPAWDMHAYIIAPFITHFGTEAQKQEWLPRMADGTMIASIGLTEPGGGSDLKELRTSAVRRGDTYVVNGAKTFITNGHIADRVLLATKTAPEAGAKGVTMLWVDLNSPGITRGKNLKKIGNKAQDTAELFFDNVEVPADCVIGGENEGWRVLMHGLVQERLVVAVRSAVIAEAAVDQTVEHVKQRKAFGNTVFDFQNTQFKLAEMASDVEVARPFVDRCITLHARGELDMVTAAKAKLWTTELADRVLDDCLQLHGGYGYVWEFPIARAWADARVHRIYAGTNEIMKYIIGRQL